jgi:hypothetical protein
MLKRMCDAAGCSAEATISGSIVLGETNANFDACTPQHAESVIADLVG